MKRLIVSASIALVTSGTYSHFNPTAAGALIIAVSIVTLLVTTVLFLARQT